MVAKILGVCPDCNAEYGIGLDVNGNPDPNVIYKCGDKCKSGHPTKEDLNGTSLAAKQANAAPQPARAIGEQPPPA